MLIKIVKLNEDINIPYQASKGSSGYDIFTPVDIIINPSETLLVKCGFKVEIPFGYEIQIRPRSGLALKKKITVLNTPGTIDSDYRDEIGVILINHSKDIVTLSKGERIAQMVLQRVEPMEFLLTDTIDLSVDRGGGFGHSDNSNNNNTLKVEENKKEKDEYVRVKYCVYGLDAKNNEFRFKGAGNILQSKWDEIFQYIKHMQEPMYVTKYKGSQDIIKISAQEIEYSFFKYNNTTENDEFLDQLSQHITNYKLSMEGK